MQNEQGNKFLNIRIGVDFYNKVSSHPTFSENWKAISPAFYFLKRIAKYNVAKEGKAVQFHSEKIRQIFKAYTGGEYRTYLEALVQLGLLVIDESYLEKSRDINGVGECKKYLCTDVCCSLLLSSTTEYLRKLHTDKDIMRKNQKSISQRKVMHTNYGDGILNYIHDTLVNMKYDYEQATAFIQNADVSNAVKQNMIESLATFTEKDFNSLHYNEADGRVFNEFVGMKSDLRKFFQYKQLVRRAVIDIRACHPTFLGIMFMQDSVKDSKVQLQQEHSNLVSTTDAILACGNECKRWTALFTDTKVDPREVIGNACGYSIEECKQALVETINGSRIWRNLHKYLGEHYPLIYGYMTSHDKLGCEISKRFEVPIMLSKELLEYTESMGIKVLYEYDGYSVFAMQDDKNLGDKCIFLKNYIQFQSAKQFNVSPVLKLTFPELAL